jgi:hypothetical protein
MSIQRELRMFRNLEYSCTLGKLVLFLYCCFNQSFGLFRKKKGKAGRPHLMLLKQSSKLLRATVYVQKLK